jgi:hypothetical protein
MIETSPGIMGTPAQTIGSVRWLMEHDETKHNNKQLLILLEYEANADDKVNAWVP